MGKSVSLFVSLVFLSSQPSGTNSENYAIGIHTHAQIIMIPLHTSMYVCTYVTRGIHLPRVQDLVVLWPVTHK